ncbi:MAG: helix-turn-helix domain-containing protein, partial [Tannerella sp.]|nr:helix-turn-helix domain-containing protein [Tannerella sp.]
MHLQTPKQKQYFKKVIKLHYEKGYGEDRISRILPIGHSTVSRWIAIFAAENDKNKVPMHKSEAQSHPSVSGSQEKDAS